MAATALERLGARPVVLVIIGWFTAIGLVGNSFLGADAAPQAVLKPAFSVVVPNSWWLVPAGLPVGAEVDRLSEIAPSATAIFVQVNVTRAASSGVLRLAGRGGGRPPVAQIAFPAGNSTTTTLLTRTAAADLLVWSSARARVQLTAMSDLPGQLMSVGQRAGRTSLVEPLLVSTVRSIPKTAIPIKGSWWTVPVLGHGTIPTDSVSAVWLSVQIKGSKTGAVSFATANTGHPRLGLAPITPDWTTSLVLATVDSTGAIAFSLRSGAIRHSRLVVLGWVAAADAARSSVMAVPELVLVAPKSLKARPAGRRSGQALLKVKLPAKVIPPAAKAVLVQAKVKTNRAGRIKAGRTASSAVKANAQAIRLPARCRGTVMLLARLGPGRRAYLAVPPGTSLDRLIVVGYTGTG